LKNKKTSKLATGEWFGFLLLQQQKPVGFDANSVGKTKAVFYLKMEKTYSYSLDKKWILNAGSLSSCIYRIPGKNR